MEEVRNVQSDFLSLIQTLGDAASSISGIIVLCGTFFALSRKTRDIFKQKMQSALGIDELNKKIDKQSKELEDHVAKDEAKYKKIDNIGKGMECSLRKDIVRLCNACIDAKHITPDDLAALNAAFSSYTALDGNMFVHDYVEKVKTLPIEDGPSLFRGF